MQPLPLRLRPGDDLRESLERVLSERDCDAAFVIAGMGSLASTRLRFAGATDSSTIDGAVEILTLSGTLSPAGSHLHMSVAGADGHVLGGHVAQGCIVRTTAEVLVVLLPDWSMTRVPDSATGYPELVVRPKR
jgi:predicted DNA-binding protein with PD1-like motif